MHLVKVQYLTLQLYSFYIDLDHLTNGLFVDGLNLAGINSHVHEWDVVTPCFLSQHDELRLESVKLSF